MPNLNANLKYLKVLIVLVLLLLAIQAWGQSAQSYNCSSYNPNPAGQFCINTGSGSTWVYPGGDLAYQYGILCSPTNSQKCGAYTVKGLENTPFNGTLANGQTWCFNSADGSLEPCTPGSATLLGTNPTVNVLNPPPACAASAGGSCTMVGDDVADNSAAMNNISTYLQAQGGGSVYFPSVNSAGISQTFRINSCISLANAGAGTIYNQNTIHIYGDASWSESNSNPAVSPKGKGSTIDWRCAAKTAALTNQGGTAFAVTSVTEGPAVSVNQSNTAVYSIAATTGLVAGQNVAITGYTSTAAGYNCQECTIISVAANTSITVALPTTGLATSAQSGTVTIESAILPQSTINVDQTSGWANGTNTVVIGGQTVTCTGTTSNTFTGCSGGTGVFPVGASVQDTTGPNGKLQTLGAGELQIDHISFMDGGSDCTPFIFDTNTTLKVSDVSFYGTAGTISACNDAFVLGGTVAAEANSVNDTFNGAGTVIEGTYYNQIRRALYAQSFGTSIFFEHNNIFQECGSNLPGGAAVELDGETGSNTTGNSISHNRFEVSYYPYGGIKVTNGQYNTFMDNAYFDSTAVTVAFNRTDQLSGSSNNFFSSPQVLSSTIPMLFESKPNANPGTNTYMVTNYNTGNSSLLATQYIFSLPPIIGNAKGPQVQDASGNAWQTTLSSTASDTFAFVYTPASSGTPQTGLELASTSSTSLQMIFPSAETGNNYLVDEAASGSFNVGTTGAVSMNIIEGNTTKIGIGGSFNNNTQPVILDKTTIGSLAACNSSTVAMVSAVTDSDSACSFGNTPTHSSCTVGTNCYTCQVQCAESGSTSYAWIAY